jgi:polar amino acid transport system ATP-binding protein
MADKENTDENILIIDNIRKAFDDLEVLKGISLTVARGEVVAVIGPSGGGKSTLLRCATTLEKIDSGKIVIGGQTLCDTVGSKTVYADKHSLLDIRSKFGLVFQNFNLFPHFSVRPQHYRGADSCPQAAKGRGRRCLRRAARENGSLG